MSLPFMALAWQTCAATFTFLHGCWDPNSVLYHKPPACSTISQNFLVFFSEKGKLQLASSPETHMCLLWWGFSLFKFNSGYFGMKTAWRQDSGFHTAPRTSWKSSLGGGRNSSLQLFTIMAMEEIVTDGRKAWGQSLALLGSHLYVCRKKQSPSN